MREYLHQACESVDAAIFSGDVLWNDTERAELKKYIERWTRAIAEHEVPEPATLLSADRKDAGEPAGHFIRDFGGEPGRWQQCKGPAHYTEPLYTRPQAAEAEPLTDKLRDDVLDADEAEALISGLRTAIAKVIGKGNAS